MRKHTVLLSARPCIKQVIINHANFPKWVVHIHETEACVEKTGGSDHSPGEGGVGCNSTRVGLPGI